MTNVIPSSNLKWSNNTEYREATYNTWIKLSTISPTAPYTNIVGTVRVYYEWDPGQCYECFDPPMEWSSFQLMKNGVGIGTVQTGVDKGWYPWTEDVCIGSLTTTDTLELWAYYSNTDWGISPKGAAVRNFQISFDTTTNQVVGSATFTSSPSGARIWIDGFDQGVVTPYTVTNICPGTRSYTLKLAGYQDATGTFSETAGVTTTVPMVTLTPATGSASFTSVPSGATIWIDGTSTGLTTPNTVSGIPAGTHNYTLKLAGYSDATGPFSVTAGSTTTVPTMTLTPVTGSASFTSVPSGATIWIDGTSTGVTTPNTITNLSTGGHSYTLKLTGYADASGSFSVTGGSTTTVPTVTFAPSLYITSTPSGASIYIDTILQGVTTPATITNLSIGSHSYRLFLAGYNVSLGNFTTTGGQTTSVSTILTGTAMAFLTAGD